MVSKIVSNLITGTELRNMNWKRL